MTIHVPMYRTDVMEVLPWKSFGPGSYFSQRFLKTEQPPANALLPRPISGKLRLPEDETRLEAFA